MWLQPISAANAALLNAGYLITDYTRVTNVRPAYAMTFIIGFGRIIFVVHNGMLQKCPVKEYEQFAKNIRRILEVLFD